MYLYGNKLQKFINIYKKMFVGFDYKFFVLLKFEIFIIRKRNFLGNMQTHRVLSPVNNRLKLLTRVYLAGD